MADCAILTVVFFRSASENEPVRDWLKMLAREDRKIIGEDVKTVQFRWPLGMPLVRKIDEGLWEVRSSLSDHRIVRVFFTAIEGKMILLHAIKKKSQKTPRGDINTAKRRRDQYIRHLNHKEG